MQSKKKNRTELLIKKRDNPRQNEVRKVLFDPANKIPVSYGDRFIPRRYALANIDRNEKYAPKKTKKDVLKLTLTKNCWWETDFLHALNGSFGVYDRRVLQLSDPAVSTSSVLTAGQPTINVCSHLNKSDWTCLPRKKPLAFPDTTHDLPGFDTIFDHNLVDWSTQGQIAAALGHDVVIWKRQENVTLVYNMKGPRSLAYSPNGDFLAVGCKACDYPVLELWDVSTTEFVVANGKVFDKEHLCVHCIAWSKCGKNIVCGTHFGTIFVLSVPELKVVRTVRKHKLPIKNIKFSPTMRHFATSDSGGNIIVYCWSSCAVYLYARSRRNLSVVFDWHPWNGYDFAIAEEVPASIVILNVNSKEIVAHYQRKDTNIVINSLSFSKLTAELLVGISNFEAGGSCTNFKVLVLSSLDRTVDIIDLPETGARFMMWSPDGKQLATAGSDETLTLWNFYLTNENKCTNLCLKFASNEGKQLFETKFGAQFKMWSCIK